jgi:hypothetical protein
MEDMKMTHQALPLAVYDQQSNYVEPAMVQSMVKGSLVQMHFYNEIGWGIVPLFLRVNRATYR